MTRTGPEAKLFCDVLEALDRRMPGRYVTGSGDQLEQIRQRLGEIEELYESLPVAAPPADVVRKVEDGGEGEATEGGPA